MSSAVVSTSAALGRPFVFDDEAEVGLLAGANRASLDWTAEGGCPHMSLQGAQESPLARLHSAIKNQQSKIFSARVTPASQLHLRPAPEMVSSGAPAIDALAGGLPRGCLTEICGPASSGRTTLLLAALAAATRRGEFCVVVDASDALDPHSAAAAGVELDRLLWVRCGEDTPQKSRSKPGCPISRAPFAREACPELVERVGTSSAQEMGAHSQPAFDFDQAGRKENGRRENGWKENASRQSEHRLEQVLRATDLLLESGGFGLIVLDLGDLPPQSARHIPLTTWFRFRRAVEYTPTILLAIEQQAIAGSCSSLLLKLGASDRLLSVDEPAAERRQNAAHSVSRGLVSANEQAPEGRKRMNPTAQTEYPAHTQLLTGLNITAELIRSRLDRKPAHSVAFATKTAWAG
jgi:recombination protein RecA